MAALYWANKDAEDTGLVTMPEAVADFFDGKEPQELDPTGHHILADDEVEAGQHIVLPLNTTSIRFV